MPNFDTAALAKGQALLIGAYQSNELRFRRPVVHELFLRNTTIMVPDYEGLRTREDRVVETNYFTRQSRALGSARSHNHTGSQGDSSTFTPTWNTYTDETVAFLKEADNKVYTSGELMASKLNDVIANFAEGLETAASTFLFSNRTGVNNATVEGTFDATDAVFQVAAADEDRAVQITKIVMDINKYQGIGYSVVCDSVSYNKFEFQANQGTGNSDNLSFQFGGVEFIHDPELSAQAALLVGAYTDGFWIAVPSGSVAALPWIPLQNREGIDTKENMYGSIQNPIDGMQYAVHSYEERVDGTANGGYTQDLKTETQISVDLAYTTNPLSTATETSLYAFAIV
jgi:hypothetical protein